MANFHRSLHLLVLAILLCLTGVTAIALPLPVEQYPDLAPPNVQVGKLPRRFRADMEKYRDAGY